MVECVVLGRGMGFFAALLVCTRSVCRSALAERLRTAYKEAALWRSCRQGPVGQRGDGSARRLGDASPPRRGPQWSGGEPGGFRARQFPGTTAALRAWCSA